MANTPSVDSLVAQFVSDLTTLVRRSALEQVLASLGGDAAPVRRGPGRPKGSGRPAAAKPTKTGGRIRRSPEDLQAFSAALLAHVKANPGQRGEQIAAALRTDVKTMRGPMHALIAAKQVRTEGQRRGMTYFAGGGGAKAAAKSGKGRKGKRGRGKRKGS